LATPTNDRNELNSLAARSRQQAARTGYQSHFFLEPLPSKTIIFRLQN
jgi:hypothetical protein